MHRKELLINASAITLAMIALASPGHAGIAADGSVDSAMAGASAQAPAKKLPEKKPEGRPQTVARSDGSEIVVTGIRNSLAKARKKKREAESIVDVVEAEDIGKLPNNTLGDVIASIPGISVTREEGEVSDIKLRGLSDVQTTIGGTPVESALLGGASRSANIQDLPADLVASVEVYKTRTPDQVEGSGAGTINVVLRRPVDFNKGLTVSVNATARYNNQSRKFNQTYTAITNYNLDTGIGRFGAQLGLTVNTNPVLESAAWNEPLTQVNLRQVVGPQILPLPTFGPARVSFRYNNGNRTTPSINGSFQWSPDDRTSIVVSGNYNRPTFDYYTNWLFVPVLAQDGSTNTLPELSNIKLVPGTNRLASATVSPVTQFGPTNFIQKMVNDSTLMKLNADHKDEYFDLSTEIAYAAGKFDFSEFQLHTRFVNRPTYDVEFASDKYRYPMMNLEFRDLDLLDPSQYRFHGVSEYAERSRVKTLSSRVDLTLRPPIEPIQYLKFGLRYADRQNSRRRFGRNFFGLQLPISALPEGFNKLNPMEEGFGGTGVENNARWMAFDRFSARENLSQFRQFMSQYSPAFATDTIPGDNRFVFNGREQSIAAYGTLAYRTKLLFPIDGLFGVRATNTIVNNRSLSTITRRVLVNGIGTNVTSLEPRAGSGNYLNVNPTATAVIHFTSRLQTRLSYNTDVRRPSIDQISPFITLNEVSGNGTGGNPALEPQKTTRYDSIIEYYFGQLGLITVNPYYWKIDGSFANFQTTEFLDADNPVPTLVTRPYNAGKGYRRGVELQGQLFFRFLPGILKNFGVQGNLTYVESKLEYERIPGALNNAPGTIPLIGVAKNTYNLVGLFERGTLNARLSYNYNGSILMRLVNPIRNSIYLAPREWVDAAVNYSIPSGPLKNLGFSLQVQNLLSSVRRSYYGFPDQPESVIYMARTYGGTIRYKF